VGSGPQILKQPRILGRTHLLPASCLLLIHHLEPKGLPLPYPTPPLIPGPMGGEGGGEQQPTPTPPFHPHYGSRNTVPLLCLVGLREARLSYGGQNEHIQGGKQNQTHLTVLKKSNSIKVQKSFAPGAECHRGDNSSMIFCCEFFESKNVEYRLRIRHCFFCVSNRCLPFPQISEQ